MARVAVVVKVYPDDVSIEPKTLAERIKSKLPQGYEVLAEGEVPIAFGLKALKLVIAMNEETEGGTEEVEQFLRNIEGVQEVEVESVSRMQ
ncbi:elongation factor 1-beta [Aeropyrum camini]|uniref:Elongation factor 1-beta n=1 Tax=Aeropyrum camini SY1 = JCM 12091 TaxID=1198449 RepID=U3TI42_9CREN|nr:elongation factor 1-beta [Aeropyrum camini]BAN91029.1 elongation factor 1-beta [Aeropyrum camini SY1 = JCM 12091]